jgi:hypothetical protein
LFLLRRFRRLLLLLLSLLESEFSCELLLEKSEPIFCLIISFPRQAKLYYTIHKNVWTYDKAAEVQLRMADSLDDVWFIW